MLFVKNCLYILKQPYMYGRIVRKGRGRESVVLDPPHILISVYLYYVFVCVQFATLASVLFILSPMKCWLPQTQDVALA